MLSKFGMCSKCMFLTAIGLVGSLIVYGVAVFAGVGSLKLPAMLAIAFFAVWSLLHMAGYVMNGRKEVKEGCSSCNSNSFALTRRGFMGAAAWLLASLGMKGVAARIVQPEVTKLEGIERAEVIRTALRNEDVTRLIAELTSKGYKLDSSNAIAYRSIGQHGKATYVYIPFLAKSGYQAGVGYLITEEGSRAFAVETWQSDRKTFVSAYFFDADGNLVVLSGDEDYWECIASCIAVFCTDFPWICHSCGYYVCYIGCIQLKIPHSCALCLACIGTPILWCAGQCA